MIRDCYGIPTYVPIRQTQTATATLLRLLNGPMNHPSAALRGWRRIFPFFIVLWYIIAMSKGLNMVELWIFKDANQIPKSL